MSSNATSPMLSALLSLPSLLFIVASARPAKKCGVLIIGLLACTAGVYAQQLPAVSSAFSGRSQELVVVGGTAQQEIGLNDFAPELKDGTSIPPQITGSYMTRSFSLTNMGSTGQLNITAITLTGWSSGFFTVAAVLLEGKPQSLPLSLAPGQHATVTIRYEAVAVGKHTATLTILNNDEDKGLFAFMLQASTIPDMTQPDEPAPLLNGIASATSPHLP